MPRELAPVESIFNWSASWGSTERTRKSFQVKYFVQAAVVGVLPPPDPSSVEYAKWSTTGLPVPRRLLDDVMRQLGARPGSARHWVFGVAPAEMLVEIPNHDIPLDADRIMLPGGFVLGSARLS